MPYTSLTAERLFPLLLDNIRDYALFLIDASGEIVSWTPSVERIFGYSEAEFVGQHAGLIYSPEDRQAGIPENEIQVAVREGSCFDVRWHVTKEGKRFWGNGQLIALRDENHQIQGFAKLLRDDSVRKQLEDELVTAQRNLQNALQAGRIGTWDFDVVNNQIFTDPLFAQLFGVSEADSEGASLETYLSHIHPEDLPAVRERVGQVIDDGTPYEAEYRVKFPDNSSHWMSIRGQAEKDAQGQTVRMMGVGLDVTERYRSQQLLQLAQKKAEESNRIKDEFLAMLSHELRSPLNAILGWANILRTNHLDEETRQAGLEVIERNTRAQAQLIEDLLDVSRILTGKLRLNFQPLELSSILEDAVATAVPTARAKNIAITTDIDQSLSIVAGDSDRLGQIFWNLFSNALKFTPKGGQIGVEMKIVDAQVQVKISDSGCGIAPEFLPHVFERFTLADSSTTRVQGGLGIGLGLVYHLVEAHGGDVAAQSEGEGQGATFTVSFPLMAVQPDSPVADDAFIFTLSKNDILPGLDIPLPPLSNLRVLIVDDDFDSRSLTALCLRQRGAEVTIVASAAEAFAQVSRAYANQQPFSAMVSDIGMPEEDGLSLIRRIRGVEVQIGGLMPSIALTAYAGTKDKTNTLLAGFQSHLTKPVDPVELVATVAALVGRTGIDL